MEESQLRELLEAFQLVGARVVLFTNSFHIVEIRRLLEAFHLMGIEVVLFLQSFHVVGYITKVDSDFVILQKDEAESNVNDGDLKNPNQLSFKISDIVAISNHRPKKNTPQI